MLCVCPRRFYDIDLIRATLERKIFTVLNHVEDARFVASAGMFDQGLSVNVKSNNYQPEFTFWI